MFYAGNKIKEFDMWRELAVHPYQNGIYNEVTNPITRFYKEMLTGDRETKIYMTYFLDALSADVDVTFKLLFYLYASHADTVRQRTMDIFGYLFNIETLNDITTEFINYINIYGGAEEIFVLLNTRMKWIYGKGKEVIFHNPKIARGMINIIEHVFESDYMKASRIVGGLNDPKSTRFSRLCLYLPGVCDELADMMHMPHDQYIRCHKLITSCITDLNVCKKYELQEVRHFENDNEIKRFIKHSEFEIIPINVDHIR